MKFSVIKQQRIWWTVSLLITLAGFAAMIVSYTQFQAPLRPGLDFIGGTRLQLELDCSVPQNCDRPIDSAKVREILAQQDLGDSSIQVIENYGLSIRSKTLDVNQRTQLENSLSESLGKFNPQKLKSIRSGLPLVENCLLLGC